MSRIFNVKPNINKRNGQINLSLRKSDLPLDIKKAMRNNPLSVKSFKLKLEGYE